MIPWNELTTNARVSVEITDPRMFWTGIGILVLALLMAVAYWLFDNLRSKKETEPLKHGDYTTGLTVAEVKILLELEMSYYKFPDEWFSKKTVAYESPCGIILLHGKSALAFEANNYLDKSVFLKRAHNTKFNNRRR